jgi:DNA-binding transcriptional ArsR family regulator
MSSRKQNLPLSDRMMDVVAARFWSLGEPLRLRIVQVLQEGEAPVGEIAERLEANQSNVSRHLQNLHDAGLVARRRDGSSIFYSISDPTVLKICRLFASVPRKMPALNSRRSRARDQAKADFAILDWRLLFWCFAKARLRASLLLMFAAAPVWVAGHHWQDRYAVLLMADTHPALDVHPELFFNAEGKSVIGPAGGYALLASAIVTPDPCNQYCALWPDVVTMRLEGAATSCKHPRWQGTSVLS